MSITFLGQIVVASFALYVLNAEERSRLLRPLMAAPRRLVGILTLTTAAGLRLRQALRESNPRAIAGVSAAALFILALVAHTIYQRSLTDVMPEIERVIAIEDRTAGVYQAAVKQFQLGAVT